MTVAITDFGQFTSLRTRADQSDPAVLREAASQFEALFIQTMMKNMRDSELAEPIFGQSDQHQLYQDMMDQQLSLEMASGRGIGLADMLVRQLGGEPASAPVTPSGLSIGPMRAWFAPARTSPGPMRTSPPVSSPPNWNSPAAFVRDIWPHVERAAEKLNIAPLAILAHAALESGWGKHVMRRFNGASSLNLFGIKVGNGWRGDGVTKPTLEYSGGTAKRETARFRAYPDVGATFRDYVDFIAKEPRYLSVRDRGDDVEGFAKALQKSGYATDPNYAKKITRVAESSTMRDALLELETNTSPPTDDRRASGRVH